MREKNRIRRNKKRAFKKKLREALNLALEKKKEEEMRKLFQGKRTNEGEIHQLRKEIEEEERTKREDDRRQTWQEKKKFVKEWLKYHGPYDPIPEETTKANEREAAILKRTSEPDDIVDVLEIDVTSDLFSFD